MPQPAMTAYERRTLDRANAVPPRVISQAFAAVGSAPIDTPRHGRSGSPRDKGAAVELSWPQVRVLRRVAWPVHSSLVLQASRRLGDGDGALGCKSARDILRTPPLKKDFDPVPESREARTKTGHHDSMWRG
ncbi:hypothetical protein CSOJ01_13300 [Colletotrichum sojae]|uniref:Uncharacterized protein n=1 Tax=Colletotrichum sojae TaxID=2175907 RepID=A0A8H6ISP2_9PEZI|nr:hypothetical protein CSOJ01_13300 [Colletotrichum sojae]